MEITIIILIVILVAFQGVSAISYTALARRVASLEEYIIFNHKHEKLKEKEKELKRDLDKMLSSLVNAGEECDCENCNPGAKREGRDINEMFSKMFKNAKVKSCSLEELLSVLKKEENEEKRKTSTEKKGETNDQDKHEDQGKAEKVYQSKSKRRRVNRR